MVLDLNSTRDRLFWLVLLSKTLCCLHATAVEADDFSVQEAFAKEIRGLHPANGVEPSSLYSFEMTLSELQGNESETKRRHVQLICESDHSGSSLVVLSEEGNVYAYLGNDSIFVVSSETEKTLLCFSGLRFRMSCYGPIRPFHIRFDGEMQRSLCQLCLFRYGHGLLGMECSTTYDETQREYCFRHVSEATINVVLRDSKSHEVPLFKQIELKDRNGKSFEISNIRTRKRKSVGLVHLESKIDQSFSGMIMHQVDSKRLRELLPFDAPAALARLAAKPIVARCAKEFKVALGEASRF